MSKNVSKAHALDSDAEAMYPSSSAKSRRHEVGLPILQSPLADKVMRWISSILTGPMEASHLSNAAFPNPCNSKVRSDIRGKSGSTSHCTTRQTRGSAQTPRQRPAYAMGYMRKFVERTICSYILTLSSGGRPRNEASETLGTVMVDCRSWLCACKMSCECRGERLCCRPGRTVLSSRSQLPDNRVETAP